MDVLLKVHVPAEFLGTIETVNTCIHVCKVMVIKLAEFPCIPRKINVDGFSLQKPPTDCLI